MIKQFFKPKNKKTVFICQITENHIKVVKCKISHRFKREFVSLEAEAIPLNIDDKSLTEKLNQIFKKLQYYNNPVIISLPRSQSTVRYLKIPSLVPGEIERISQLQAPHYLPYPANELITGYQTISTDKEGYSYINLIIVHKDVIDRYLGIFKEMGVENPTIVLSSYGLSALYNRIGLKQPGTTMIIDIDTNQAELAIVSDKKLLFSRSFKLNRSQPNWEDLFIDEINKSQGVYLKEIQKEPPSKFVIIGPEKISSEIAMVLNKTGDLAVEILSYAEKIKLPENLLNYISTSESSFASILGLGLEDIPKSLDLLPQEVKEQTKKVSQHREYLRLVLFISGTILITGAAIAKHLDNKTRYLAQLKMEMNKIAKEAKPLEEIEKRFLVLRDLSQKKPTSLEILYELNRIVPTQISLINLSYEEGNQVILRGQTPELNSVFVFVSQLEKSAIFKNFKVKVRYATKKKIQTGEIVDFEIVCIKK